MTVFAPGAPIAIAGFALGAIGMLSAMPVLRSASTVSLPGQLVGAHIAIINSIGNLGCFFGSMPVGWLHTVTHSFLAGFPSVSDFLFPGTLAVALVARRPKAVARTF